MYRMLPLLGHLERCENLKHKSRDETQLGPGRGNASAMPVNPAAC